MLENAARICDAKFGNIYRWDGEVFHLVATHNTPPTFAEARRRSPMRPRPDNLLSRMVATKAVIHVADYERLAIEQGVPEYVTGVELGGVRTSLFVPMLKDNELIGYLSVYRQEVCPFTDKRSISSRILRAKPSSPLRMRGCSPNCASALTTSPNRWSSRRRLRRCSRSSPALPAILSRCSRRCLLTL